MFERFYPDFSFESIDCITEEFLQKNNIKFILLDIDNTLVSYKTKTADERARRFLHLLTKNSIEYVFVSNNHRGRVELFAKEFDAFFVNDAKKPLKCGIKKAMQKLNAKESETALIGDQIFTDVYAGKRSGIITIMVKPIEAKETPFFRIKRQMEKIVLKNYNKQR